MSFRGPRWAVPRVPISLKRPFADLLEDELFEDLFETFDAFPPSKCARYNKDECCCEEGECDKGKCDCEDDVASDKMDAEPTAPTAPTESAPEVTSESPNISVSKEAAPEALEEAKPSPKAEPKTQPPAAENSSAVTNVAGGAPSQVIRSLFNGKDHNFQVNETDEEVTVSSTWEGFNKGDLKVDFKDGSLVVSGKSNVEHKDEKTGAVSRSSRSVSRVIRLPKNIDRAGIRAKFKDDTNTLTINVPKTKIAEKKPDTIVID